MVTILHKDSLSEVFTEANLRQAWVSVERKDSAAGIDRVSVAEFARDIEENLRELREQVLTHSYVPAPLVCFQKPKSTSGWRDITVSTVRDRVVGRCAAEALSRRFNHIMVPQSYAYRPEKSALRAVAATQHGCRSHNYVLRLDIESFFDSIDHELLFEQLRCEGIASDFVELLQKLVKQPRSTGYSLQRGERGIPQGSQLAPVLSNLYLTPFDSALQESGRKFVRYADDLVIFAASSSEAYEVLNQCRYGLGLLRLEPNQSKTRIYQVDSGFVFLGFVFNRNSHVASREARTSLRQKLDRGAYADESRAEWRSRRDMIVRGWSNYFKPERGESLLEYSSGAVHPKTEEEVEECVVDNSVVLPGEIEEAEREDGIAVEGSQEKAPSNWINSMVSGPIELLSGADLNKLCSDMRRLLNAEEQRPSAAECEQLLNVLAKVYRQLGMHGAARRCLEEAGVTLDEVEEKGSSQIGINCSESDVEAWLRLFGGVAVYHQYLDRMGRNGFRPYKGELQADDIKDHWEGRQTLSVSVYSSATEVRYAVVDLDISRQHLEMLDKDGREALRGELLRDARNLLYEARRAGVEGVIEDSCYKGYHLWFFFETPQSAAVVREFLVALCQIGGATPKGTHRELFPGSDSAPADGVGSRMRLPLGIHKVTGERSVFLTADGLPSGMGSEVPGALALVSGRGLREAIRSLKQYRAPYRGVVGVGEHDVREEDESFAVDAVFEDSESLRAVARGCAVLRVLVARARQEQHLCHAERIILRGILMPAGPEGRQALHGILSLCRNYNQKITEKYATTHNFKPVSCARIKEILGEFTDRVGCNCEFKPRKNNYAHPLRHINRRAGTGAQQVKAKCVSAVKSASTAIVKPRLAKGKETVVEGESQASDTVALVVAYRDARTALLEAQRALLGVLGGAESLETPVGRLKLAGADTEVLRWQLDLVGG